MLLACVPALFDSCKTAKEQASAETKLKDWFRDEADSLLQNLTTLDSAVRQKKQTTALQQYFLEIRLQYKRTEVIIEYYFQGLTKRINGPALPDVKTEDGVVWPPHGFQVIEQYLYSGYNDSLSAELSKEIGLLQTDIRFIKTNMQEMSILPGHVDEMLQHEFIRIAALGTSGFDAPLSKLSLQEADAALDGLQMVLTIYKPGITIISFADAKKYLEQSNSFDDFDRMEFMLAKLLPLSNAVRKETALSTDSSPKGAFAGSFENWLNGKGFNPDYYAGYAEAMTNPGKVELGQQLFFDTRLSASKKISCGTCHEPSLYFTDGKAKAGDFVHGGSLLRNTPTLYYAALQSQQFYDLRSVSLEDQAHDVMKSSSEFNLQSTETARLLNSDTLYKRLFKRAFANNDSITGFQVRNAIAAYVRSLSPFSSRFDEYIKGNRKALSSEEIKGANLFLGKAKCGTCHFMPVFNGTVPPWYAKSESEIIGVPAKAVWSDAVIDNDSGRYRINAINELLYAFKTPTVRNVEKTGPYMHNGVYKTLDEVVEFYHKGGGVGIGIDLPFQSLPFDSLQLNATEKKAIVSFVRSLTDKPKTY